MPKITDILVVLIYCDKYCSCLVAAAAGAGVAAGPGDVAPVVGLAVAAAVVGLVPHWSGSEELGGKLQQVRHFGLGSQSLGSIALLADWIRNCSLFVVEDAQNDDQQRYQNYKYSYEVR